MAKPSPIKIGEKYGKLTVISCAGLIHRMTHYNVKCDCGKEKRVRGAKLNRGEVVSCGCIRSLLRQKTAGMAGYNMKYNDYILRAKYKNLKFELSFNDFCNFLNDKCYYCDGMPKKYNPYLKSDLITPKLENVTQSTISRAWIYINGIDRVDSYRGYIYGNCITCCATCNRMKMDMSFDKFIDHIKDMSSFLIKKGY